MAESPTNSPSSITAQIPIEIISEEEMAFIEAAMAVASRSIIPFNRLARNVRSLESISLLAKRGLSSCNQRELESVGDIEDLAGPECSQNKRIKVRESFLNRFRRKRGLGVTDVTGAEWCEKQMEYKLEFGKPKPSKAMQAGVARHADLEDEVCLFDKLSSASGSWNILPVNMYDESNL